MEISIVIKIDGVEVMNTKTDLAEEKKSEVSVSQYARFFDENSPNWSKDVEYNLMFLKQQQDYANSRLKAEGFLYLNDVYDMLGIPRTKAGQLVGWIYNTDNPTGDNYVDFGLHTDMSSEFVNGYKKTVLLDFNVDGNIWDLI